jgi:hypothetical protein
VFYLEEYRLLLLVLAIIVAQVGFHGRDHHFSNMLVPRGTFVPAAFTQVIVPRRTMHHFPALRFCSALVYIHQSGALGGIFQNTWE